MNNPNITRLVLLKTSLENDYKHTLYFNGSGSQRDYFLSRKVKDYDFTNLTYIRKDHSVKVPLVYDDVVGCNYVMYQNKSDTKWYYAFITDIRYISEGVSELILETDCIQSWLFAYTVRPSFVEREHVDNDTVGLHTYPEPLELGDFVNNEVFESQPVGAKECIIVASTIDLEDYEKEHLLDTELYKNVSGSIIGGVYSGLKYYEFFEEDSLNKVLVNVADNGKIDGIVAIFIGDDSFYDTKQLDEKSWSVVLPSNEPKSKTLDYVVMGETTTVYRPPAKPTTVNGYTPRNKKLLTYPYCHLYVSNNAGGNAIYRFEKFKGKYNENDGKTYTEFKMYGSICPGMSIRMLPLNYDNKIENNEEGLNFGKLPICSFNVDLYTNWLTQNGVNIATDLVSGVINTGFGLATAGAGGGMLAVGGVTQIASTLGQVHQMSFTPPQARGNLNSGDVTFAASMNRISMYSKSIKQEYAKIIDGYFDMFGYKVCRVKQPNTHHRSRYWYTKTIDVNIDGAIPNKDLQVIKNAYNNGITFWRNGNEIGDYSLSNEIKNIV